MDITLAQGLVIVVCAVAGALLAASFAKKQTVTIQREAELDDQTRISFLFAGETLEDCTAPSMNKAIVSESAQSDWATLHAMMSTRFPDFPKHNTDPCDSGPTMFESGWPDDTGRAVIQTTGGKTKVHIEQDMPQELGPTLHAFAKLSGRVEQVEYMIENAPAPVWHTNVNGEIDFANASYRALCDMAHSAAISGGQLPELFRVSDVHKGGTPIRQSLMVKGSEKPHWFDIHSVSLPTGMHNFAIDVNAVVNSQVAQRNFVQTLAKTFAQLSTGLAIFDRNRQLALFNPALMELTKLPVEFLSARPALFSFFDRMRESKMMPEPKSYSVWRDRIARLAEEALDGTYSETWSLPSGLTYRVTGRPHPDGALAFLFEDITAEITLTRGFRAELDLGHSVLDNLDHAIAVFSPNGALALSNQPFREMWKIDPDNSFSEISIFDCCRIWSEACANAQVWSEITDFVMSSRKRAAWDVRVATNKGAKLTCRVTPISGGATMVAFRVSDPAVQAETTPKNELSRASS